MTRRCITREQATATSVQHEKPCSDCPWSRSSLAGWLGGPSPEEWIQEAHGDGVIECHTLRGPQCAGAAIYRANVCKMPRDRRVIRLPADKDAVFSNAREFIEHHERLERGEGE